jgi:hypothetical protein
MAFNPTLPQTNAPISSAELREQFVGLKDLIDQGVAQCAGFPDVSPLQIAISNPPTQAQVMAIVDRFNELLDALKRA